MCLGHHLYSNGGFRKKVNFGSKQLLGYRIYGGLSFLDQVDQRKDPNSNQTLNLFCEIVSSEVNIILDIRTTFNK